MSFRLRFKLRSICQFGFVLSLVASSSPASAAPGAASSAISIVESRYVASVLPGDPAQIHRLQESSSRYAKSLQADGKWPDIEYRGSERSAWFLSEHLNRTLVMAKSSRIAHNTGHPNADLDAKVLLALRAWTDGDYQNPNWWWNEIGVPQLTGEIAALMQPELPSSLLSRVIAILKRSNWRRVPWTGANLIWGVENEVVRGCLEGDPATVAEGYNRMYEEIKIVGPTAEGIQQDYSFHQHGHQLYNGGYGLSYADDVGRFITFAWGTSFQIPPDRMTIFSAYILDGLQWMIRGDIVDYSVVGREITRKGKTIAPSDWTTGPLSPAGPAYSLEHVINLLAVEPTPRQRKFQNFAARLHSRTETPAFAGNKQFWNSDFMAHRRKEFYTSVKMLSERMVNGEVVNGEGLKSQHLSDGVNLLYLTGEEYKDIFPVWDWTKLPGTTAIQGTLQTGERNPVGARGTTTFDGGVSDGTYGMAAMDLHRGNLTAKKAWFFFDHAYLCLGAGITLTGDTIHRVATDVNQTHLIGPVTTNRARNELPDGAHAYSADTATWIFHHRVGYVFPAGGHVALSTGPQTGRWSDIGSGSTQPVTVPVFNLWIDHGISPDRAAYQYIVLPAATVQQTIAYSRKPPIQVLANEEAIQAAWDRRLHIGMIAFRRAGSLTTPAGEVAVDHSCLLLIKKAGHRWNVTAENPENLPLMLHMKLGGREAAIDLPGGNFAGSSVTVTLLESERGPRRIP